MDAILTNAAGCGSAMHEYHLVLRGTADEARAEAFRKRVMDVSVFLRQARPARTACAKSKPQGRLSRRLPPRERAGRAPASRAICCARFPASNFSNSPTPHLCCGSAGTYNLDQPEIAASLGEQKARAVIATGADVVASGNIGCLTQLRLHLKKLGATIPVKHTMQLLRDALASPP